MYKDLLNILRDVQLPPMPTLEGIGRSLYLGLVVIASLTILLTALSLLPLTVMFCWNSFWSPVFGLAHLSFSAAVGVTLSAVLLLGMIFLYKETK